MAGNVKWVRLGDYIEQCDERNVSLLTSSLIILLFYIFLINSYLCMCATQKRVARNVF